MVPHRSNNQDAMHICEVTAIIAKILFDTIVSLCLHTAIMKIFIIVSGFLLFPLGVFAQTNIENNVRIRTNTGGNEVSQEENSTIRTGDSNVSIGISNQVETSQTSESESRTETSVRITTDGDESDSQVQISLSNGESSFRLEHRDGQTKMITTDGQGNIQERQIDPEEDFEIELENQSLLRVRTVDGSLLLEQNNSRAVTQLPIKIDQQKQMITIEIDGEEVEVGLYPEDFESMIGDMTNIREVEGLELTQDDLGRIRYQATAKQQLRFLGLLPVDLETTISTSATSESEIEIKYSNTWSRFLALISW